MGRKKRAALLIGLPLVAALGLVAFTFGRTMAEQLAWYPRDQEHLEVRRIEHARSGIVLTVYAPSRVEQVWRQHDRPTLRQPQHHLSTFFSTPVLDGEEKVLVPYEFSAGDEWLLALRSTDGHWVSMSPYFPSRPEVSEEDWQDLLSTAERRSRR